MTLKLGSSNYFNKALEEFKFKHSTSSIKINFNLLLNEDLFVKLIISLIFEIFQ